MKRTYKSFDAFAFDVLTQPMPASWRFAAAPHGEADAWAVFECGVVVESGLDEAEARRVARRANEAGRS